MQQAKPALMLSARSLLRPSPRTSPGVNGHSLHSGGRGKLSLALHGVDF